MESNNSANNGRGGIGAPDGDVAGRLYKRYRPRMLGLARRALGSIRRGIAGASDLVNSAFKSFLRGIKAGRIELTGADGNDLPLLFVIIRRKAAKVRRSLQRIDHPTDPDWTATLADGEPGQEEELARAETLRELEKRLGDEPTRQVFRLWLEGLTEKEIIARDGTSARTVRRKKARILTEIKALERESRDE